MKLPKVNFEKSSSNFPALQPQKKAGRQLQCAAIPLKTVSDFSG
jgi:hypothetical protein